MDYTIQDIIRGEVKLDIVKGVTVEVYNGDRPNRYIVTICDRRIPRHPLIGSFEHGERKTWIKISEILRQYGKEA